MQNIAINKVKFQKIYASRFMTLIFFVVSFEIYALVMIFLGGGR
jgi:hypothetical protein